MALFKYLFVACLLMVNLTQGQLALGIKLIQQAHLSSTKLTGAPPSHREILMTPPKNQTSINGTSTLVPPTSVNSTSLSKQLTVKSELEATSSFSALPLNLPPIKRKLITVEQVLIKNEWYIKA